MTELRFTIDLAPVERVLRVMPKVAYFWLRDYFVGSFISHRLAWLRGKSTRFGRGGRGIKVWPVGEGPTENPAPLDVVYGITPRAKRAASSDEARATLAQIGGEAFTGNVVLPVHEFGPVIKARNSRFLAIPMKGARPGNITKWKQQHASARLIARPIGGGRVMLFEVTTRGNRNTAAAWRRQNPDQFGPAPARVQWSPRFLLVPRVQMHPTLKFYSTWDSLAGRRDELFAKNADKMIRDLEADDPRDR